jgi:lysyl-tRNA synthetase class 2
MSSLEELRKNRLEKLLKLKQNGVDPYPAESRRTLTNEKAAVEFENISATGAEVVLAGRVMAIRSQGAIIFVVFNDGTANFQALIKKDVLLEADFQLFTETIDVGDFAEFGGSLFRTRRGEKTVMVKFWRMLVKTLLPLPEKWHGLQDPEEKLRKRYLDFLFDAELREVFKRKEKFWDATRSFLKSRGFLEVETPILEVTTGGAEARPFQTHHYDFDLDVFLRISVGELWQKRLMAGGFSRTFEIGRVFRNEGSSQDHLQEFTGMEFYASFMSFEEGLIFSEELIRFVVQQTFGRLSFESRNVKFNLSREWPRLDYSTTIKSMTGVDVFNSSEEEIKKTLKRLQVVFAGENRERLIDTLWKYCRRQIDGPAWLVNHPKLVSPLAKANPTNPNTTLRAQLILCGVEVTNGYEELNDPTDQKSRFTEQAAMLEAGDQEAMMPDWEFVEMLEHGMPPVFSMAYGERLFAILENRPLREVTLFPLVKPKR